MARGHLIINPADEATTAGELAEAFAAFGLQLEDDVVIDDDEFWLWPENEETFWIWAALQTQWTASVGGAIGLNYAGVESYLRMRGIRRKRQARLLPLLQTMEHAALEEWASKQSKR